MYHIALCDDSPTTVEQIERMLKTFPEGPTLLIKPFLSGVALKAALRSGQLYDLIILDIRLDGMTGIDIARLLREELHQRVTPILYISSYTEYTMELFHSQAHDFLIKPIQPEHLHRSLRSAMSTYSVSQNCLTCIVDQIKRRIPFCVIQYLESKNKLVEIATVTETISSYAKLSVLQKQLPQEFLPIHKSFIVNDNYVKSYAYDTLSLFNGIELPISRSYRDAVDQALWNRADHEVGVT